MHKSFASQRGFESEVVHRRGNCTISASEQYRKGLIKTRGNALKSNRLNETTFLSMLFRCGENNKTVCPEVRWLLRGSQDESLTRYLWGLQSTDFITDQWKTWGQCDRKQSFHPSLTMTASVGTAAVCRTSDHCDKSEKQRKLFRYAWKRPYTSQKGQLFVSYTMWWCVSFIYPSSNNSNCSYALNRMGMQTCQDMKHSNLWLCDNWGGVASKRCMQYFEFPSDWCGFVDVTWLVEWNCGNPADPHIR